MEEICRLCCSTKFVNNDIFDEENALYLKMSLYLPIKVFKNDRLPQKICDKCSCKVNDFYQFCNETIEVQNRLRSFLIQSGNATDNSIDFTVIKYNASPPPPLRSSLCEQSTQTEQIESPIKVDEIAETNANEESKPLLPLKVEEDDVFIDFGDFDDACSNNSDDISLMTLKKKKSEKRVAVNGDDSVNIDHKKQKLREWEVLMNSLPEGTAFTVVKNDDVPTEIKLEPRSGEIEISVDVKKVKTELEDAVYHCCICLTQCSTRNEMLQHYRQHLVDMPPSQPSAAPPPPSNQNPLRCTRCRKVLEAEEWNSHWQRHWERDRRPYRCVLCEKTFRDHHQVFKHGLTHDYSEDATSQLPSKRFVCDLCPEGFVYMRNLLSHRTRAHPEAAARALALRCGQCARQFAHLNSLRRHLRAHSGERNHLCNVCGKALSSREHLKFHLRIHTGYKPNVCKTCGKGFVKKCNLTLHERVHSGEKPHVCSHCRKAFSQRSTLVIHERYHSGARPYVCSLCGRGFVAKGLLSMHLKNTCV